LILIVSVVCGQIHQVPSEMEARFREMEARFGEIKANLSEMHARFGEMEARFGEMRSSLNPRNFRQTHENIVKATQYSQSGEFSRLQRAT
jgi:hypothetical protein